MIYIPAQDAFPGYHKHPNFKEELGLKTRVDRNMEIVSPDRRPGQASQLTLISQLEDEAPNGREGRPQSQRNPRREEIDV